MLFPCSCSKMSTCIFLQAANDERTEIIWPGEWEDMNTLSEFPRKDERAG